MLSLRRKYASLFPPTGSYNVFTFLSQKVLSFFLYELIALYEQVSSRTS